MRPISPPFRKRKRLGVLQTGSCRKRTRGLNRLGIRRVKSLTHSIPNGDDPFPACPVQSPEGRLPALAAMALGFDPGQNKSQRTVFGDGGLRGSEGIGQSVVVEGGASVHGSGGLRVRGLFG